MSAYILSIVPLDGHLTSFYYAPPDTVGIEFGTSCLRTVAVNRRCGGNPGGCNLLARQIVGAEQSPAPTGCRANKEKSMQKGAV